MSDFASAAAAVSGGYTKTQTDMGASHNPRYKTVFDKPIVGLDGESGSVLRAEGWSNTSAAAADTVALDALNVQRAHRWGYGSNRNKSRTSSAVAGTLDVT
jgi:hypothetical protein